MMLPRSPRRSRLTCKMFALIITKYGAASVALARMRLPPGTAYSRVYTLEFPARL